MWLERRYILESVGSTEPGVKTNRGWNVFRSPIFISATQFVILLSLLLHCFPWEPGDMLYQYYIYSRMWEQITFDFGYVSDAAWIMSCVGLYGCSKSKLCTVPHNVHTLKRFENMKIDEWRRRREAVISTLTISPLMWHPICKKIA